MGIGNNPPAGGMLPPNSRGESIPRFAISSIDDIQMFSLHFMSKYQKPRVPSTSMKPNTAYLSLSLSLVSWLAIASPPPVLAQIVPDTTLPNNSAVNVEEQVYRITGGTAAGSNLFHSFREFSLPTGEIAHFENSVNIQNIFSRITGGSISHIDGMIQANGNANLFLMNPNGILFGPNARLNIGGSFLATTASSIEFSDSSFSATEPQTAPLLTVSVPIGLQFGNNPGRIVFEGQMMNQPKSFPTIPLLLGGQETVQITNQIVGNILNRPIGLQVFPGKSIAFVGGEIDIMGGNITTGGGRIELGSVGGNSHVPLNQTALGWGLEYETVENFQSLRLSRQASLNASGIGGGEVQIRGGEVTLTDESAIASFTLENKNGGELSIQADRLQIQGGTLVGTGTGGIGNSGDITITTQNLTVQDQGIIETGTLSEGNSGNLTIRATESVKVFNNGFILSSSVGEGMAGNIVIDTQRLTLQSGGEIASGTGAFGDGGNVSIRASDSVEIREYDSAVFTDSLGSGTAGNLTILTGKLLIADGGGISASTRNAGQGGTLTVEASESVEIRGMSADGRFKSGLFASSGIEGFPDQPTGDGGNLLLTTGELIVRDGARVGVGSLGTGNAGIMEVYADFIRVENGGEINAATFSGEGGNIILNSNQLMLFRSGNITTNAGSNNGGNITIDTDTLVGLENSDITANAREGVGGQVSINATGIFGTEFRKAESPLSSDITATSELGAQFSGVVEIKTPEIQATAGLVELPNNLLDVASLMGQDPCKQDQNSEFIVTGRGGLPPTPFDPLTGMRSLVDLGVSLSVSSENQIPPRSDRMTSPPLIEATGWKRNVDGTVILTADGGDRFNEFSAPPDCNK